MSVPLLWQPPVFYIIFAYSLMKRTLTNFGMSLIMMMVITIVNYQLMYQDHKLLQRRKPDDYLSQPLIHVISAIIVNNCAINS